MTGIAQKAFDVLSRGLDLTRAEDRYSLDCLIKEWLSKIEDEGARRHFADDMRLLRGIAFSNDPEGGMVGSIFNMEGDIEYLEQLLKQVLNHLGIEPCERSELEGGG